MKRGQLSYEYLIIVGVLITLVLPFFYFFFQGTYSVINDYYGTAAVQAIADGTRTIYNLGQGSSLQIPLLLGTVQQHNIYGSLINIKVPKGDISAEGVGQLYAGKNTLVGDGIHVVRVKIRKVFGSKLAISSNGEPIIICLTTTDEPNKCYDNLQMQPNQKLVIRGDNFESDSAVIVIRQGQQRESDVADSSTISIDTITLDNPIFGSDSYTVQVFNSGKESGTFWFNVGSGGKGDDDAGV